MPQNPAYTIMLNVRVCTSLLYAVTSCRHQHAVFTCLRPISTSILAVHIQACCTLCYLHYPAAAAAACRMYSTGPWIKEDARCMQYAAAYMYQQDAYTVIVHACMLPT